MGHERMQRNGTFDYGRRWQRVLLSRQKLSTRNLKRLCEENATCMRTLVVHSEDVNYKPYFPNAFTVTKRRNMPADMHVDIYYNELSKIPDTSYKVILCSGLLEHVPDPVRLISDLHRILMPNGRLIISASAVFSFHEGPHNFYHFTPFSFKLLFKDWAEVEMIRGSSQPFETIGILLQRILLQCDIFPVARPLVEVMARGMRFLDGTIYRQYHTWANGRREDLIDSMMPSNIQAIVRK